MAEKIQKVCVKAALVYLVTEEKEALDLRLGKFMWWCKVDNAGNGTFLANGMLKKICNMHL